MFLYTTAIKKLRKMSKRVRIVPGGTSAAKTYGIIPILIDIAARIPDLEISIVSESVPHLRKGALKDFLKIMKQTGRYNDNNYNRTLLTYTFADGSYIEFFSADQEAKVRGPRRNILFINECNNITFETYHQLAIRTDMIIWLDFNPSSEFWVHTELAEDEDTETLVLTYKDNEGLGEAIIKEIEKGRRKAYYNEFLPIKASYKGQPTLFQEVNIKSRYWDNWWRVYGLGMLGELEGVIFDNWTIMDSLPRDAVLIGRGQDYGFTNDPTTMMAAYRWRGSIIWDEELYQRGMTNGDIAGAMKTAGVKKMDYVVGDSAEPKSIVEINQYGFTVHKAVKGADSIKFGIDVMQEEPFFITRRSVNAIKELRTYAWDVDKEGKRLNKPIDYWNHCIDAMRYLSMAKLSKQKRRRGLRRKN